MAFCCDYGSKKEACECLERSRSRERSSERVEEIIKKLAADFSRTTGLREADRRKSGGHAEGDQARERRSKGLGRKV